MIVREDVEFFGTIFDRTYSDADLMIYNTAEPEILYEEAVDPKGSGRTYAESDTPIDRGGEDIPELDEIPPDNEDLNYWADWE